LPVLKKLLNTGHATFAGLSLQKHHPEKSVAIPETPSWMSAEVLSTDF
jgi:hypothetical protein